MGCFMLVFLKRLSFLLPSPQSAVLPETVVSFLKIFRMMTAKCRVAFNHLALPPGRLCLPQIDFLAVSLFDVKIKLDDFFPSLS